MKTKLHKAEIKDYFRRTKKNKIMASIIIGLGCLHALMRPEDNGLFYCLLVGIPVFLTKEDIMNQELF